MSIFEMFQKKEVEVSCCHCQNSYKVRKPRAIKKKGFEKGHWETDKIKEELNGIYAYEYSEVISFNCPVCNEKNYIYLNKDMDVVISKEKPENTLLAKELLNLWIKKS